MPKVSVIMAVHNGQAHLQAALDSIFQQSFSDFELLVIDDASTDGSAALLAACSDSRLQVFKNPKQLGLAASLNIGLERATGEHIARMDHDDVSLPRRFERQVTYLDMYPDIDVLGTWAVTLGLEKEQTWAYPTADADIRSELIFNPVLVHSSVMLRRESLLRAGLHYDPQVPRAQDYDLWTRAAEDLHFANLPEVLLQYRIHPAQVGNTFGVEQQTVADKIRLTQVQNLGLHPAEDELALHNAISRWQFPVDATGLTALERWFLALRTANRATGAYPAAAFDAVLERRWWAACRANVGLGLAAWYQYRALSTQLAAPRALSAKLDFVIKAGLASARRRG